MEDYKEKYEMALEKAKILLSKCKRVSDKASMIYRAEDIESMFPEFQKPEEEKIKEALIELVKCNEKSGYTLLNNVSTSSMINWLEKQDQKTIVSQYESKKPYDGDFIGTIKEALGQNDQNSNMFWHDISEEPEEHREIFCKWEGYADSIWHDVVFYHSSNKTFWNGEQQIEDVIKWTYVDEILNKSNPYSGVSFEYNNHTWGMCARDGGVEISIDNELKAFVSIDKSFIYPIQPQSYLAPKSASQAIKEIVVDNANKVELKFQEGDFIKHNNSDIIYKVFSIDNDSYFLKNIETDEIAGEFERFNLEQNFHLWTIKDAKDGDVLWHSDSASNGIFIFKEIRHDGKVLCYCDYDSEDHFCLGEHHTCCWINDKYIKPATKEQRYLLFKKMKEAGYKWNVDEKELIKL